VIVAWPPHRRDVRQGEPRGVSGCLLASVNTASEYGFGAVDCGAPRIRGDSERAAGDLESARQRSGHGQTLAGITGSASGGLSLALAAMAGQFKAAALAPTSRWRSFTARRDGRRRHGLAAAQRAIITLLAITGLTRSPGVW